MADAQEQVVRIDDKEYKVSELSDAAKTQLVNLRVVDQELARLQQQTAIAQTARNTYAKALNEALGVDGVAEVSSTAGDSFNFS